MTKVLRRRTVVFAQDGMHVVRRFEVEALAVVVFDASSQNSEAQHPLR